MAPKAWDSEERDLGLDTDISRRDFLGGTLLGAGGALLWSSAPAFARDLAVDAAPVPYADDWTGYGGVGDYAPANGNTKPVLDAAHLLRDDKYAARLKTAADTGETYDVVIVGGGISGLTAAYTFAKAGRAPACLVLENHAMFGGEAKVNEFLVDGVKLAGPQASNQFGVPSATGTSVVSEAWNDFGLPRSFQYQPVEGTSGTLRVPLDHYAHMDGVNETQVDVGYYFDQRSGASKPTWIRNIWQNDLADAPFSAEVRRDLLRWRTTGPTDSSETFRRALDSMTYAQYLEQTLKLSPEVTKYIAPVVGLINGASPDAVSAFAASQIGMPGVSRPRGRTGALPQSFPGGNATFTRHFVKFLLPNAIAGPASFEGVNNGRIDFAALDREGSRTRIRLGATVVRVEHERGVPSDRVVITYAKADRLYRVKARAVVMASGGPMSSRVLADAPPEIGRAFQSLLFAPALVVNVALTNWRFLDKLGAPCCRWFGDDFGFSCNVRRPMITGVNPAPFRPDRPAVLTFYMGLQSAGKPLAEQCSLGRQRLLSASYADYERQLRQHMTRLFGPSGFDARRDIAGVVLNRWGHARLVQPPGFYYGREGQPSPRMVLANGFGRVAIGHSELNGHQSHTGAMTQGRRAAEQALTML